MIVTARICAWVLLTFSALVLFALLLSPASKPLYVGAMTLHAAALTVILLALYGWRNAAMTMPGLALSILWGAWGLLGIGIWLFTAPPGLIAVMALCTAVLFYIVPAALCILALRQISHEPRTSGS